MKVKFAWRASLQCLNNPLKVKGLDNSPFISRKLETKKKKKKQNNDFKLWSLRFFWYCHSFWFFFDLN